MTERKLLYRSVLFFAGVLAALPAVAQRSASATATQQLGISVFGAGTGTWTKIRGGRNLGITAGADLSFMSYRRFRPSIELRGTYPIKGGTIASEKNFMGGVKVEYPYGNFHPYANFLIGRGEINYQNGGFVTGNLLYFRSQSTIFSPGFGVDYDVAKDWAIKGDYQFQHWDVPVLPSGSTNANSISVGVLYRFDFNQPMFRRRR